MPNNRPADPANRNRLFAVQLIPAVKNAYQGGFALGLIVGMSDLETQRGRRITPLILPAVLINAANFYLLRNHNEAHGLAFAAFVAGYLTGFSAAKTMLYFTTQPPAPLAVRYI